MRINDTLKSDDYAFLVCGEVGMDSEFDKWIRKEGFKGWGRKGYYCTEPHAKTWSFIDLNTKTFAPAVPGIQVAKPIGNHAITVEEFKQIYKIYKKYEGKALFVFKNERFDYDK